MFYQVYRRAQSWDSSCSCYTSTTSPQQCTLAHAAVSMQTIVYSTVWLIPFSTRFKSSLIYAVRSLGLHPGV